MLLPDKDWMQSALHFCVLEKDASERLAFFRLLEVLQVSNLLPSWMTHHRLALSWTWS